MKKELSDALKWADETIENSDNVDLNKACDHLSRWILYFQHERLIHLIVTSLIAILTVASFFIVAIVPKISILILATLFLSLAVAYILHYYRLENTTQALYHKMDKLIELKEKRRI